MPKWILWTLVVGSLATAYLIGTKAGTSRYRQISGIAKDVWDDPGVKKVRDAAYRKLEKAADRAARKI